MIGIEFWIGFMVLVVDLYVASDVSFRGASAGFTYGDCCVNFIDRRIDDNLTKSIERN